LGLAVRGTAWAELKAVYDRFGKGFSTSDLRAARRRLALDRAA
jgi:hypothetical protein